MDYYIGLDAHSKTCTYVCLNKEGDILRQGTFSTNERNLKDLCRSFKGETALVLEETNIAQWLYVVLKDEVDKLVVCHPAYLPMKSGPKNDYRDALHLAHQLRSNNLTPVFHEDSFLMNLRTIVSNYENVNLHGTNLKYNFKSLLRSDGVQTQSACKTVSNPEKWKELKTPSKRFVAEKLYEQIVANEKLKAQYVREFRVNILKEPSIRNLSSLPGVGKVRAHIIAAYISSAHRFENKHKLWSYAKLIRHRDESDGYVMRKRTPHGRSELKAAFMGAAQRIIISASSTALQDYFLHLIENKKLGQREAKKALARKIAAICLVIMKKGTKYDDDEVRRSFQTEEV